jgi:transposase
MMNLPPGTKVYVCCRPTDMRKGFNGLTAQVSNILNADPYSGHLFVFRGKRGDYVKILYWDGTGLCLFAKRLEKSRFVWPPLVDGGFQMSTAQLGLLLEGMDWRRTVQIDAPRQPVYA